MQRLIKFQTSSWLVVWFKKFTLYCLPFIFFLSNFSCQSPKSDFFIDKEDRETVNDFLRYIAISKFGIYTILGSKPVTGFDIPHLHPENESKVFYNKLPEDFKKKVSFEKFYRKEEIEKLHEICSKWKKIQHKYIGEHFVIHFDEKMYSGYLLNIPLVVYILRRHCDDFSKVLGINFDPMMVLKEIDNDSSSFWKIFKDPNNAYLMGLLFGFGEKNSKLFQWEKEKSISFPFRVASYDLPSFKKRPVPRDEKIENLCIPQFVVYQPTDEIVEKYLVEKERIIQIYKGKDFAETTIAFLKGQAASKLSRRKKSVSIEKVNGKFIGKNK